jgi:hypothetical protein
LSLSRQSLLSRASFTSSGNFKVLSTFSASGHKAKGSGHHPLLALFLLSAFLLRFYASFALVL